MTDAAMTIDGECQEVAPAQSKAMALDVQGTISQMISAGNIEQIGKLIDYQERINAHNAKSAYLSAIKQFKAMDVHIERNKKVPLKNGTTKYTYATLDNVVKAINPALDACGLSFRWKTEGTEAGPKVTCIISHIDGFEDESSMVAPPEKGYDANKVQAIGSTITYLQRYTLLAALGLQVADDDDGRGGNTQSAQQNQQRQTQQANQSNQKQEAPVKTAQKMAADDFFKLNSLEIPVGNDRSVWIGRICNAFKAAPTENDVERLWSDNKLSDVLKKLDGTNEGNALVSAYNAARERFPDDEAA